MLRTSLLLVVCLLAAGGVAFASDTDPIQASINVPAEDTFAEAFSKDLQPQELQVSSTQGFKTEVLHEYLPEQTEETGVVEDVKNLAKGTFGLLSKPPTIIFGGIKNLIDYIPGAGSKPEQVETVEKAPSATYELDLRKKEPRKFFEREFAKQLASHRTAEDFADPVKEGQRGKKIIKMLLLLENFGPDK